MGPPDYPFFNVKYSVLCPLHTEGWELEGLPDAHQYTSSPTNRDVHLPEIKTYFYSQPVYAHFLYY